MSRRNLAVLGVTGAAAAAVAIAAPVLAQSNGGQTITFHELNKGSRFAYTDNPPRNAHNRRPNFSVGDQITLANPLADDSGTKLGELRATCTFTKKGPATDNTNSAHPFCSGAFVLKSGTVFVETADAGGTKTEGAVVGGTGA